MNYPKPRTATLDDIREAMNSGEQVWAVTLGCNYLGFHENSFLVQELVVLQDKKNQISTLTRGMENQLYNISRRVIEHAKKVLPEQELTDFFFLFDDLY